MAKQLRLALKNKQPAENWILRQGNGTNWGSHPNAPRAELADQPKFAVRKAWLLSLSFWSTT